MPDDEKLRITLKLNRSDCPTLFDDLSKIRSGARRTMRLRLLATMGLHSEAGIVTAKAGAAPPAALAVAPHAASRVGADAAALELLSSSDLSGVDG